MERQQPRRTHQDHAAPAVRRPRVLAVTGLAAVVLGSTALAGCSSDGDASSTVSSVASAAQSAISAAASAAQSAVSEAASAANSAIASGASGVSSAAASAEAAASSAIAGVKGGLDAKDDVTLGAVTTASDGKVEVVATVTDHASQSYRYSVQVNFTDASGNVLDAAVANVPEVAAGQTSQATVRSNRSLSGGVSAIVARAVRY